MEKPGKEILTIPQVAEILQVHVNTIWRWIYLNRIPSVKLNGARRIRRKDLDRWIESQLDDRW